MRWLGIGYRTPLSEWIDSRPAGLSCLELTAEHFFDDPDLNRVRTLRNRYALFVHGLGLSLGTPGPLDRTTLQAFKRVSDAAAPEWISEHVAFTAADDIDLGHLNPLAPTRASLQILIDHARELSDVCQRPLLLENITSHLRVTGELSETEFLNALCAKADCRLLLDVTNLYINAQNHGFDPLTWLRQLEPSNLRQLHIVGYSKRGAAFEDYHGAPIQDELIDLLREVLRYAPVEAVILERDDHFDADDIARELKKLEAACAA